MAKYTDDFIARLELLWGRGFLSPGGVEEVALIVGDAPLAGRSVLDIGTGTGGPALVLARDHGARVTGIDVEAGVLHRARALIAEEGLADRVELRLVDPGPLPFPASSFDIVFSKDSLVHIPDKRAIYAEIGRVLRPGGRLMVSDWLTGPGWRDDPALTAYLEASHLDLQGATADEVAAILADAGFEDIETLDRNAWFADLCAAEQATLDGPEGRRFKELLGAEEFQAWYGRRANMAAAAHSGALRPTHIRARRPA